MGPHHKAIYRDKEMVFLKKLIAKLPIRWQTELKRIQCMTEIKRGAFVTDEPEYKILHKLLGAGDWAIDIGANIGHYTKRFSDLVGPKGRVIAFEPVPTTFYLLSSNIQLFNNRNVSLINAAVSEKMDVAGIALPFFSSGLPNYYQAQVSSFISDCSLSVLTFSLDSLSINKRVSLVKIDAEGHEDRVLAGMKKFIISHRPALIIETCSEDVIENLISFNYIPEKLDNSPNILFKPQ